MSFPPSTEAPERAARSMTALAVAAVMLATSGCSAWSRLTSRATTSTTITVPLVAPSTPEVAALASRTAMSDEGRRLFFSTRPEIVDKSVFGASCPLREEISVLGCYHEGPGETTARISLLKITDAHLDGMEEVTAAHELLHAVWDHTSNAERGRLTTELTATLATVTDQRIIDKVASYRSQDPSVVPNELHSILGTEVVHLSAALEEHYRRWFTNRGTITALAATSQKVFDDLHASVQRIDAQVVGLRSQIDGFRASLAIADAQIEARRQSLEALEASGQINAYNARVPGFNGLVAAYNRDVGRQRKLVDEHNALVAVHNELAVQFDTIESAIDTTTLPRPIGTR